MIKKLLSILFIAMLIIGCVKVHNLDNIGQVESFEIIPSSITDGVELAGVPVVIGSSDTDNQTATLPNTINIFFTKGQYISPIEFRASIAINKTSEDILNLTPYIENGVEATDENGNPIFLFTFSDVQTPVVFYVIAESGHAQKWEVELVFSALEEAADITQFDVKSTSDGTAAITQRPSIQNGNKKIDLYFDGNFPITINPTIVVSSGAVLKEEYSSLTFSSSTDIQTITVTSESGNAVDWEVQLGKTVKATPEQLSALSVEEKSRMAVNYSNMKPMTKATPDSPAEELKLSIDSVNARIYVYTTSRDSIDLNIDLQAGSEILGNQNPILSASASKIFIMDMASKLYREWNIYSSSQHVPIVVMGATFASSTPAEQIVNKTPEINLEEKVITFYVNKNDFDVTLNGLTFITNIETSSDLPNSAQFTKSSPSIDFTLFATGASEQWIVEMEFKEASTEAKITDFEFADTKIDWSNIYIEHTAKKITVAVNQKSDLDFIPNFTISKGASIKSTSGEINNNVLSSIELNSIQNLTVTSEDGATQSQWTMEFIFAPQLGNRGFEKVSTNAKGYDYATNWESANVYNTLGVTLIGTTVNNETIADNAGYGNAIKVITQKQNALIFGNVIAAGTVFKGEFNFSLALDFPRKLTKFGIPFSTDEMPLSFSIDAKYKAGESMSQAIKNGIIYSIQPTSGTDRAHVYLEMINYTENGGNMARVPNSYSGDGKNGIGKPAEGVNLLSRAELIIDGKTDTQYHNWQRKVERDFVNKNNSLPVTHIVFVTTSSLEGDKYLGAIGSVMWIDNVIINYYKPEMGATIKNRKQQ